MIIILKEAHLRTHQKFKPIVLSVFDSTSEGCALLQKLQGFIILNTHGIISPLNYLLFWVIPQGQKNPKIVSIRQKQNKTRANKNLKNHLLIFKYQNHTTKKLLLCPFPNYCKLEATFLLVSTGLTFGITEYFELKNFELQVCELL